MKDVVMALRASIALAWFTIFSLHLNVYRLLPFIRRRTIHAKSLS
jgi:hypothetical protein